MAGADAQGGLTSSADLEHSVPERDPLIRVAAGRTRGSIYGRHFPPEVSESCADRQKTSILSPTGEVAARILPDQMSAPFFVGLIGPTAVGKSALALALAAEISLEVVSLDSMQVYQGLDIGTAKPSLQERRRVPHHLVDLVAPDEPFTAFQYGCHARGVLREIHRRGRLPLVVGGSGLYLRALRHEIFPGPPGDSEVRNRLMQEASSGGLEGLHTRLGQVDPITASRIHPRDALRIIRALEIFELSGRPISEWRRRHRLARRIHDGAILIGLSRPRDCLYARIDHRVKSMVTGGLVEEVQHLLGRGFSPHLKPFRSHNYRHIISFLAGNIGFDEAVRRTQRDTRRYAKRQMTWFRAERIRAWVSLGEEGPSRAEIQTLLGYIREAQARHGAS